MDASIHCTPALFLNFSEVAVPNQPFMHEPAQKFGRQNSVLPLQLLSSTRPSKKTSCVRNSPSSQGRRPKPLADDSTTTKGSFWGSGMLPMEGSTWGKGHTLGGLHLHTGNVAGIGFWLHYSESRDVFLGFFSNHLKLQSNSARKLVDNNPFNSPHLRPGRC